MKMKRLFTLVLSLMMILSLSAPASSIDGENVYTKEEISSINEVSTKRSLSDWGKISSIEYCENILDEKISEIRIRKGIDSAKWAVFSDEDLVNKWMEFLSTIEVRRVDNAGRGQQEQNGGNFVVEIDTETEEYCLVFKSTDAIMQLEVNDADYDVKMPEDFPFEETYNKAIERYGVKGPWD